MNADLRRRLLLVFECTRFPSMSERRISRSSVASRVASKVLQLIPPSKSISTFITIFGPISASNAVQVSTVPETIMLTSGPIKALKDTRGSNCWLFNLKVIKTYTYQDQFVKTLFRRVWSKMSYGYFRNPWDLPHLVHRSSWP